MHVFNTTINVQTYEMKIAVAALAATVTVSS